MLRESMDGYGTPKRPLTEVKEEPQERDEDQTHNVIDHGQDKSNDIIKLRLVFC